MALVPVGHLHQDKPQDMEALVKKATDFYTYDHLSDHASPWHIDLFYRKFNVGFSAERFSTKYLQRYGH